MKFKLSSILVITALFSVTSCTSGKKPPKNELKKNVPNSVELSDAWVRPATEGANSAGYLTIFNGRAKADTLLGIQTDAAKMAKIHETYRDENGMMGMRPAGTIIIQPDSSFVLKPGGFHIMLMQLNQKMAKGDSIQLSFNFAASGVHKITVPVKIPN